jgi:hypothetical protein
MKKTGKSGCGHLKKMEKQSRELAVGRAILETQADLRRMRNRSQRKPA